MGHTKAHYDFAAPRSDLARELGLKNLGFSVYRLKRGEGFDFFHNHREQEEVYLCLEGRTDLMLRDPDEHVTLEAGDIVRVEPRTLRALGNSSSDDALVLIAGACPHPYPEDPGHVIADVLSVVGRGSTGFSRPIEAPKVAPKLENEEC